MKIRKIWKKLRLGALMRGQGFFGILALMLVVVSIFFVVRNIIFLTERLNHALEEDAVAAEPPQFDLEKFKALNIIGIK